jgi:hypothetical protein
VIEDTSDVSPFLVCDHQFGDFPIKDPNPESPFPYTTQIQTIKLWYDEDRNYVISPTVGVLLRNFKAVADFPLSVVDIYYYNSTLPGQESPVRQATVSGIYVGSWTTRHSLMTAEGRLVRPT